MMRSMPLFVGLRYASARKGGLLVRFLSRVSVASLVLGVAMLVTVLSVMNGFEKELQNRILNLVPHIMIMGSEPVEEWQTLREVIDAHPSVVSTAPFIHIDALLSSASKVETVKVHSVDPVLEEKLTDISQFVTHGDFSAVANQQGLALGKHVARKLGLEIGGKVRMIVPSSSNSGPAARPRFVAFELVAIFHTGTEIDQELAIISLAAGQKLLGLGSSVQGVRAQTTSIYDSKNIGWDLVQQLPPGYYARDWRQLHGNLYEAIQMSRRLVTLMIVVVIAVALFNVVSALVMVVTDKGEDIAILKTLGAETGDILRIFLVHGVIISVLGTGLGVAIGAGLSLALPNLVAALEQLLGFQFLKTSVYPVDYIPADLRLRDVLVIAVSAVIMSIIATLYPAYRASKVKPAEALRWH